MTRLIESPLFITCAILGASALNVVVLFAYFFVDV